MEEILSSIRRIIADEEAEEGKTEGEAAAAETEDEADLPESDEDDDEDVLELTKVVRDGGEVVDLDSDEAEMAASENADWPEQQTEPVDEPARDEVEFAPIESERPEPAEPETHQEEQQTVSSHQAATEGLISDAAATAATGAFAKLSHAFQRTPPEEATADDSGRTVEQFVEDMIRPMLKEWMDENLPVIVERLVEKEIQKIARRSELM